MRKSAHCDAVVVTGVMAIENSKATSVDPGLLALVMLLRFYGLGADPEQIRHRFGAAAIGIAEILRCAKELGLNAQSRLATWEQLVSASLPGIVGLRDGGFLLLGKLADGKALVQSPLSNSSGWRPSVRLKRGVPERRQAHVLGDARRVFVVRRLAKPSPRP